MTARPALPAQAVKLASNARPEVVTGPQPSMKNQIKSSPFINFATNKFPRSNQQKRNKTKQNRTQLTFPSVGLDSTGRTFEPDPIQMSMGNYSRLMRYSNGSNQVLTIKSVTNNSASDPRHQPTSPIPTIIGQWPTSGRWKLSEAGSRWKANRNSQGWMCGSVHPSPSATRPFDDGIDWETPSNKSTAMFSIIIEIHGKMSERTKRWTWNSGNGAICPLDGHPVSNEIVYQLMDPPPL